MPTSPMLPKLVGQRVKRREDPRLIQGRGTYVDDIALVGMQHLAFKRSDVAHGRIRSIDTQRRGGDGRRRSGVHRRPDRRVPGADADRHAVPFPRPSRGRRGHGPLRRASRSPSSWRAIGTSRETPPTPSSFLRHAAGRRRPRAGDDREADGHPSGLSEQPRGGARAERHRRERRRHASTTPRSTRRLPRPRWSSRSGW